MKYTFAVLVALFSFSAVAGERACKKFSNDELHDFVLTGHSFNGPETLDNLRKFFGSEVSDKKTDAKNPYTNTTDISHDLAFAGAKVKALEMVSQKRFMITQMEIIKPPKPLKYGFGIGLSKVNVRACLGKPDEEQSGYWVYHSPRNKLPPADPKFWETDDSVMLMFTGDKLSSIVWHPYNG